MKKSYLMIAAVAILASCSDTDKLTHELANTKQPEKIGFAIFSQKTTRADADENNSAQLYDYYETFGVYSWKTVGTDQPAAVFANDPVHYFTADAADDVVYASPAKPSDEWGEYGEGTGKWKTGWFYKNVRYWDKLASGYTFFAIAPYEANPSPALDVDNSSSNITIGADDDRYDIDNEAKNAMNQYKKYYGFSKDYMLADKETTKFNTVQLEFHHILTKLNVQITLQDNFKGGNQDLTITDLEIVGLENKGYFEYAGSMTTNGWKTEDGEVQTLAFPNDYAIYSKNAATTTYSGYYWFQTLVFPQTLTCMAEGAQTAAPAGKYLYIEYTIGTEKYKAYYDLANVFNSLLKPAQAAVPYSTEEIAANPDLAGQNKTDAVAAGTYEFAQGSEYTLNIKVGPMPIEFEATAEGWDEKETVNHSVL